MDENPLKYCDFDHFKCIFGCSCNNVPLLIRAKFGMRQYIHGLRLHAKFHLNVFILPAFGGQKPQFGANFDIWGILYRPLLPMAKTPKFYYFIDFSILWCRQLAAI